MLLFFEHVRLDFSIFQLMGERNDLFSGLLVPIADTFDGWQYFYLLQQLTDCPFQFDNLLAFLAH